MSSLRFVTLTGVDEKTNVEELAGLSAEHPYVEWGVLYSPSQAGKGGRYPTLEWIEAFAESAQDRNLYIALHLCGAIVRDLLKAFSHDEPQLTDPALMRVLTLTEKFGRVQLNTVAKTSDVPALQSLVRRISRSEARTRVILQWHEKHAPICQALGHLDAFEVLVDSSGGKGLERDNWPSLDDRLRRRGFAGGLGPDNLARHLPLIEQAAAGRAFWVDMENKLRNDRDEFDLGACAAVLAIAKAYSEDARTRNGQHFADGGMEVAQLDGLLLDWWVGAVQGYPMQVPPPNAYRAVYLYRPTGTFESFSPSEDSGIAQDLLSEERIALLPLPDGQWQAQAVAGPAPEMLGPTLAIAGLRAIVAKYMGAYVPANPARWSPL